MKLPKSLRNWLQQFTEPNEVGLPTVSAAELERAHANDEEYLTVILEAYQKAHPVELATRLDVFTEPASLMILFNILAGQVANGGFIQLIQNGYGPVLFEDPFADNLAKVGATKLAELVNQAAAIYQANKIYLVRRRDIPAFSQMYQEFKEFEPLEDLFYSIQADQTAIVRVYLEQHLDQIAHLAQ